MGNTMIRKIEIIENYKDGNRYRLKGEVLEVLTWKAEELIRLGKAKIFDDKPEPRKIHVRK